MWKLLKLDQIEWKRLGVLLGMLTAAAFFGKYEIGEWQWIVALIALVSAFLTAEWLARKQERTDISELMKEYIRIKEKDKNAGSNRSQCP